ncbi:MAG TPA: hypothetical protein VF524_14180 [Polyangia bacterium]
MLRFGYVVMVGSFVAFSLFACGDKINPKGSAPSGSTDIGGIDGGGSGGTGGSTTATVSYSKTIAPFMAKSCATSNLCHASGNPWLVDLDTYAGVKAKAALSISDIQTATMPPSGNGTVSASDLKNLQDWVAQGSLNN